MLQLLDIDDEENFVLAMSHVVPEIGSSLEVGDGLFTVQSVRIVLESVLSRQAWQDGAEFPPLPSGTQRVGVVIQRIA